MRRALSLLLLSLLGCAGRASAPSPAPPAKADAPVVVEPAHVRVVVPVEDRACGNVALPPIRSVIVVPAAFVERALAPVVHAACSCSRRGETLRLSALIVPEAGVVTAHAVDDEAADACVQLTLDGRFEAFELKSDCIDCGPKRFAVFHGSPPPPPPRSRITYPLTLVH